jgi:hypothetical protein
MGQLEDLLEAPPPSRPNVPFDDPRAQSQEESRIKMGLWRRQVLDIVRDNAFWLPVSIASLARQPFKHHHHFVMSKLQRTDLESHGNHQAQLCCGKADAIFSQFDTLLFESHLWGPDIVKSAGQTTIPCSEWICLAVGLITSNAAGYLRRIVRPTRTSLGLT